MSDKLVLIDGNSIVNRAFFGIPELTNAEGLHTNAIYGFLNIMFKILSEENAKYLAVAFDLHAPTFRHRLYAEYKGTRRPMPTELKEQIPVLKELLRAMRIKIVELEGYEADDILGTLARRGEAQGLEVSLVSGDRDLLQIATDRILIRIPKTKAGRTEIEDYHTQDVMERYGIQPLQIIDLKALMGDASDNIPGVPKIGEKTATALVQEYGSIENLREHIPEIAKASIRQTLTDHFASAEFSKMLATIETKAPVEVTNEEMTLGNPYTQEAYEIMKKLGFKNMLDRFDLQDGSGNTIETSFRTVTDFSEAENLWLRVGALPTYAFRLLCENRSLLGIALCLSEKESYFIPVGGRMSAAYLCGKLAAALKMHPVQGDGVGEANAGKIATFGWKEALHDLNDPELTMQYSAAHIFDCKIAAYLLNPLKNDYDSEDIASEHLNLLIKGQKERFGKDRIQALLQEDPADINVRDYACYEAYVCFSTASILAQKLETSGMMQLFTELEMPLSVCLYRMEAEGVLIEQEGLKRYSNELGEELAKLEQAVYKEAGTQFNINSPKQLGEILFEKMQLPGGKKTKTGYSTAADVLEKLADDVPFVRLILRYRTISKLKSTYADGLAAFIQADQRIHSTFHQTITATGRISSADPNLQNIPIRMEEGRRIRKVFIPRSGCVFVDVDYSQIELRIMAHLSGDEKLIEAYRRADDIHAITASEVFHVPLNEVTPLQRRNAKAVNFGIIYGISSFGLSQDLSISRAEAKQYIDRYFETYPQVKEFIDRLVSDAKRDGYATTLYGRRRPIPELSSNNFMQRQFGERVAMNAPIQGSAADIMKIAMIRVLQRMDEEGLHSKLLLQVHDELLVEAELGELLQVRTILSEELTKAATLSVKLEIDMHDGANWYEAK